MPGSQMERKKKTKEKKKIVCPFIKEGRRKIKWISADSEFHATLPNVAKV